MKVFRRFTFGFSVVLLCLILSCSNDIDIYIDHTPTPLVYCQVDPSDSFCIVTLSKSFQTLSDARKVFSNGEDLLVDNAEIVLEAWGAGYKLWETGFKLVEPTSLTSTSNVISRSVYRSIKTLCLPDPTSYHPPQAGIYDNLRLIITSPEFEQIIYSKVPIPDAPMLHYPHTPIRLNLYGGEHSYFAFVLEDERIRHAEFMCDFYYQEYTDQWVDYKAQLFLKLNIPVRETLYIRIFEEQFFNKLVQKIGNNPDVASRLFKYMDFTFLISDVYFHDYYQIYDGLDDNDHNFYSNINNGLGLFSVRKKTIVPNFIFDHMTFDSLCHGRLTKHLHFRDW